jgi:hypothetical protein
MGCHNFARRHPRLQYYATGVDACLNWQSAKKGTAPRDASQGGDRFAGRQSATLLADCWYHLLKG